MLLAVKDFHDGFKGVVTLDTETGIVYARPDTDGTPIVNVFSIHHRDDDNLVYQGDAAIVLWRAIMRGAQILGNWEDE